MENKVLAITGAFVPYNDTVTLISYKHLRRMNKYCDIVALNNDADNGILKDLEKDPFYHKCNIIYGPDYNKTIATIDNKNVFLGIYNILKYCRLAKGIFNKGQYSMIYTSSLPAFTHLAGYLIKKQNRKIPWVASFSDPLFKSPYKYDWESIKELNIIGKLGFFVYITIYMNGLYEKIAFKYADRLVFICEEQRDFMINNHPKKQRKMLIDKSVIVDLNYINEWNLYSNLTHKSNTNNIKIKICHMGRVYGLRDLKPFLLALTKLNNTIDNLDSQIEINQYGELLPRYKEIIKDNNLEAIFKFHNKIEYQNAIEIMKDSDYLLLIDTILDDNEIQPYLPSKMLEYSLLDKPVIAICNTKSPTNRIMIKNGFKTVRNDENQIYDYLLDIIQGRINTKVHFDKVENSMTIDLSEVINV